MAMGTRMAPAYANIFMSKFEEHNIIPHAPFKPILWKRYIDNILVIFTCKLADLQTFETWINNLHCQPPQTFNAIPYSQALRKKKFYGKRSQLAITEPSWVLS